MFTCVSIATNQKLYVAMFDASLYLLLEAKEGQQFLQKKKLNICNKLVMLRLFPDQVVLRLSECLENFTRYTSMQLIKKLIFYCTISKHSSQITYQNVYIFLYFQIFLSSTKLSSRLVFFDFCCFSVWHQIEKL